MTDLLSREEWTKRAAQKVSRTQLFIDGKFVDSASGKTFESINPRDNTVVANIAEGDKQDIDRAVAAARKSIDNHLGHECAGRHRYKMPSHHLLAKDRCRSTTRNQHQPFGARDLVLGKVRRPYLGEMHYELLAG